MEPLNNVICIGISYRESQGAEVKLCLTYTPCASRELVDVLLCADERDMYV
jgi:hypothetical protein